jgi:hypothetical protein
MDDDEVRLPSSCNATIRLLVEMCVQEKWSDAANFVSSGPVAASGGVDTPSEGGGVHGRTALHEVCMLNNALAAQFMVEALQANVNVGDSEGDTPLHMACKLGALDAAKALVCTLGAEVNMGNDTGITPLHVAAATGCTPMISLLLQAGASPEVADVGGATPLMFAAANANAEAVTVLVREGGARVGATCTHGATPLHYACSYGHTATVMALLAEGARDDVRTTDEQLTPADSVCLDSGADTAAHHLINTGLLHFRQVHTLGRVVLAMARTPDLTFLAQSLRDLDDAYHAACTCIHTPSALSMKHLKRRPSMTWVRDSFSARSALAWVRERSTGRTAMAVAASSGLLQNCQLIYEHGGSPCEADWNGDTPRQLFVRAWCGVAPLPHCWTGAMHWFDRVQVEYSARKSVRYREFARLVLLCCTFFNRPVANPWRTGTSFKAVTGASSGSGKAGSGKAGSGKGLPKSIMFSILAFVG